VYNFDFLLCYDKLPSIYAMGWPNNWTEAKIKKMFALIMSFITVCSTSGKKVVSNDYNVNGFYQQTTPHIQGDSSYLSLQGT